MNKILIETVVKRRPVYKNTAVTKRIKFEILEI